MAHGQEMLYRVERDEASGLEARETESIRNGERVCFVVSGQTALATKGDSCGGQNGVRSIYLLR